MHMTFTINISFSKNSIHLHRKNNSIDFGGVWQWSPFISSGNGTQGKATMCYNPKKSFNSLNLFLLSSCSSKVYHLLFVLS